MSTAKIIAAADAPGGVVAPLEPGDRLSRREFERRYEAMSPLTKAELIEGMVYMPSPVRVRRHGQPDQDLNFWLAAYRAGTPGVGGACNTTVRLDPDNEPQPDGLLYIEPAGGGQTRISSDDYLEGAPELIAEIAASSVSIDLNSKLQVYQRNRVQEYLVWRVLDKAIDWFTLRHGYYVPLVSGSDGIQRSNILPGLWLDTAALIGGKLAGVLEVLQQGLASRDHAHFVALLTSKLADSK